MKNIYVYYIAITAPFGVIIWLINHISVSPAQFLGLLVFYVFVYRTYTDGKRLTAKKIIPKKDIWKMVIPGKHLQYFKELYLKK